ncbi:unnamed protein product [Leptosia nina]|uniref:Uncharacterized protein n=1 Tax=Leptosia nina TaxID=320188 RepID=A0AAV1JU33_9NEOP
MHQQRGPLRTTTLYKLTTDKGLKYPPKGEQCLRVRMLRRGAGASRLARPEAPPAGRTDCRAPDTFR